MTTELGPKCLKKIKKFFFVMSIVLLFRSGAGYDAH